MGYRFSVLTCGEIDQAVGLVVDTKNKIADSLIESLGDLGFSNPRIDYADDVSDEAIIYFDVGDYTIMVRVISDSDMHLQIPYRLANLTGLSEFERFGEASELMAFLKRLSGRSRQRYGS